MSKYLLLKLAEEAGEVVVAAIKHRLHGTMATQLGLEQEVGDFLAVVDLLIERRDLSSVAIVDQQSSRYERERKRMKGK